MGVLWLAAAVLLIAATVVLFAAPQWFWLVGGWGVIASHVVITVSYTHLRAHETVLDLVCRLLLEKKKKNIIKNLKTIALLAISYQYLRLPET